MNRIQRKSHGMTFIQRFNPGKDFVSTKVMETYKFNWIGFTKWHVGIAHARESKQNIFSIELARRLKPRRGMEFHSAPQIKSVNLAVFRNVPSLSEAGFKSRLSALEID